MSLAEETREAIRDRPVLFDALRAGVLNYSAAARRLDVEGEEEAIATAIRRFEDALEASRRGARDARVRMARIADPEDVPVVDAASVTTGEGDLTAIVAKGQVDAGTLEHVLGLLRTREVGVEAAGVTPESLAVVVARRDGAEALRLVEAGIDSAPAEGKPSERDPN